MKQNAKQKAKTNNNNNNNRTKQTKTTKSKQSKEKTLCFCMLIPCFLLHLDLRSNSLSQINQTTFTEGFW